MGKCKVTLKELFSITNYLEYGYGFYVKDRVPDKFRKDILNSINLEYLHGRYYGDDIEIFNYFSTKYPEQIKKIRVQDYNQLLTKTTQGNLCYYGY